MVTGPRNRRRRDVGLTAGVWLQDDDCPTSGRTAAPFPAITAYRRCAASVSPSGAHELIAIGQNSP